MWADFFVDGNLRLPLTVFVAEVLEYYRIHISQLSPFGMIRIRKFEYTFRALGLEIFVENFRRFYYPKLMTPPKGITKWKTRFFYIKAVAVVANMTLRNVAETILAEDIKLPSAKTVEWFPRLKTIEFKKLDNSQLWVLRMMLTRPDRKARPVVREKSGDDAALWRIFDLNFTGKVQILRCAEDEDGFNITIRDNFRIPDREGLKAPLPQGKGTLGALGEFEVKGAPKKHAEKKHVEKTVRGPHKKKPDAAVVPPLVPQGAGISCSRFRRYTDYVVLSDTLEGLGVAGGGAAAGGSSAGSKPADEKKRKVEDKSAVAGEKKRPRIQTKRTTAVSQAKPAVAAEPQDGGFSFLFDNPLSPSHDAAADAGVNKEFTKNPSVKVVTEPSVQAEDTGKKTAAQIFDTVDSYDNLIAPQDTDDLNLKFSDAEKQKSDAEKHKSPAAEKASGSAYGGTGFEGPPIQPDESELGFYYRTYTEDRAVNYNRPPWNIMQGDDVSTDSSACREISGGLGTLFEVNRARALPRELRINQLSSMLVGNSIMANAIMEDYKVLGRKEEENARLRAEAEALVKAAREGAEQLERQKAAFEKHKQTEEWAATAGLKQEVTNLKAANAALMKEKAAAEGVAKEAKEAEGRAVKALAEANADRTNLNKTVEGLQNRVTILADVTARTTEAEARARDATKARDSLVSSFDQLKADRDWMRDHGIGHIVKAILDAPENAACVDQIRLRAREAGFKASHNRCISHINVLSQGKYTDERSGFHGVDTEARLAAALAAYNDMSISALKELDKCLDAEDYVDRLRLLYGDDEEEEEETAGDGKGGAGTSGTRKD
ncbi:hypothetical protein HanXRQr2_Chr08g0350891 [Helianthus annuus]|uniref:Transposase (putative) gypsy type domain-containing protein n=1 Tax=Helianthus annuus TaxID=4232 RepID=A0A9K3IG67_HELAN|nr:hypothetical protein HanXRQr2_Chr08g0350891 [Helianthus annuus]KAJ0902602.1 hypothetical protein HanPSC8_Chr08g0338921 [Helianthus annuus]